MSRSRVRLEFAREHLLVPWLAGQLRIPVRPWDCHLANWNRVLDRVRKTTEIDVQARTSGGHHHLPWFNRPHLRRRVRHSQRCSLHHIRDHRVPRVRVVHALLHPLCTLRRPPGRRSLRLMYQRFLLSQSWLPCHVSGPFRMYPSYTLRLCRTTTHLFKMTRCHRHFSRREACNLTTTTPSS